MITNRWIVCSGFAMLFFCPASVAEDPELSSHPSILLAGELGSADMHVRAAAWARVHSTHEVTIAALLRVAQTKGEDVWTKMLRSRAIEMLGEYRAVEAVDVLIREIEAPPSSGYADEIGLLSGYPTVHALVSIGEPAITRILSTRTRKPMTETEVKLFSYVVWIYYAPRQEQDVGLFRMERFLAKEKVSQEYASRQYGVESAVSVRETNLARLIDVYKAIEPAGPIDRLGNENRAGKD